MRRTRLLKVGAATVAAGAGVILALTSVMAHSTQAPTRHVAAKSVSGMLTVTKASGLKVEGAIKAAEAAELAAEQKAAADAAAAAAAEATQDAAEVAAEATRCAARLIGPRDAGNPGSHRLGNVLGSVPVAHHPPAAGLVRTTQDGWTRLTRRASGTRGSDPLPVAHATPVINIRHPIIRFIIRPPLFNL